MSDEVDLIDTEGEIGISAVKANWLLDQAGDLTEEDPEQITIRNHEHLLSGAGAGPAATPRTTSLTQPGL